MQNVFNEFDVSFRCQLINFALKINGFTHCSLDKLLRKNYIHSGCSQEIEQRGPDCISHQSSEQHGFE